MHRLARPSFLVLIVALAAGCPSGPFGARPEISGLTEGGEGRDTVTVSFELRDEDLSAASVRVEYTTGGDWSPATLTGPAAGTVAGNLVTGLRPGAKWAACDFGWDTLADGVGTGGQATATLRLTPFDSDGEGDPVEIPVTVNNLPQKLLVAETSLSFEGRTSDPSDPQEVIHISNGGPTGTTLSWAVRFEYADGTGWLAASPSSGTATAEIDSVTISARISGTGLVPGVYQATAVVEDPGAEDSPARIPVTLTVLVPVPDLLVHDGTGVPVTELHFSAFDGGPSPPAGSLWVKNTGMTGSGLAWTATDDASSPDWLSCTPTSGVVAAGASLEVAVSIDTSGLPVGTRTAIVTVVAPDAPSSPRQVAVTVTVQTPEPDVLVHDGAGTPLSGLTFFALVDGPDPSPLSFWVENSGDPGGVLSWSATDDVTVPDWLSYVPDSGNLAAGEATEVPVSVSATGLTVGSYGATIVVTAPGAPNSPVSLSITFEVTTAVPEILLHDGTGTPLAGLRFRTNDGDPDPAPQSFWVENTGDPGSILAWTAADDVAAPDWLSYSPESGNLDAGESVEAVVSVSAVAPTATSYFATITVSAPGAPGSPVGLPIAFEVRSPDLFHDIGAGLPGLYGCSLAWGDYDGDGDLDLALAGRGTARLYRNDGGAFAEVSAGLHGVDSCDVAWGDYDGDGDLDLALAGYGGGRVTKVYRNDGGTFFDINAGLTGVRYCSLAWGDYDNDGDLDLALAGSGDSGDTALVARNVGADTFEEADVGLPGLYWASLGWGDYDGDGDLDLALTGGGSSTRLARIYDNEGSSFVDAGASLEPVNWGGLAWGDYDGDGGLDLVLAGTRGGGTGDATMIFRNEGGTFADIDAGLTGIRSCSLAWGDYDNDGELDLAMAGTTGTNNMCRVCRNDGGRFTNIEAGMTEITDCSIAWGDFDNDGDLDLAASGFHTTLSQYTKIYRNDGAVANTPPSAPDNLLAGVSGVGPDYSVTFSWGDATDAETPSTGLSYNLRVGTSPGGSQIMSGMALADGRRLIPARGPIQPGQSVNEWTLQLPADTYYWSVQAIDTGLVGSAWAPEEQVTVP